jgi:hypothetical protein
MARGSEKWPGPEYHVTAEFRAPLAYVYRWCTDFDVDDGDREKEEYERKLVRRGSRRVIFEDLVDSASGWNWARHEVTLLPPDRWHSDSLGSHRAASIDYVLTSLGPDRTRLDLRWRRAPTGLGRKVSKAAIETATTRSWKNFARELEKDYRKSRRSRRRD